MPDILQTCRLSGKQFLITDDDQIFYTKMNVPLPTICPDERRRHLLATRNLRNLYHRKCDLTGREMISNYASDSPHTVYYSDEWWSDKWDPLQYGREFDFSRLFFDQWKELYREVPVMHLFQINNENCDFINGAANCKDCYLSFDMDYCEKNYYVTDSKYSNYCLDCLGIARCDWCYECIDCQNSNSLYYSHRAVSCQDSYFLSDCRRCKDCIGCANLVDKQYCIFNKQYTKEEYETTKAILLSSQNFLKTKTDSESFSLSFPKKYYFGHTNEEFSGDNIQNVKNSHYCFDSFEVENCKYCIYLFKAHDCMDIHFFGDNSEWLYYSLGIGINASNIQFSIGCWNSSSFLLYCNMMSGARNCFGCSGLKQKQYCILNKQYTKEEYESLLPKIIQHMKETKEWGEFFPISCSGYGYNETVANDFFPMTKEEALARGYQWTDKDTTSQYQGVEYSIPENITEVKDDIVQSILKCQATGKPYKIIRQELDFYRKMNIAIPKTCPEVRYKERSSKRNSRSLYDRQCAKCAKEIQTSYAPNRPETVFCEECYLASVY